MGVLGEGILCVEGLVGSSPEKAAEKVTALTGCGCVIVVVLVHLVVVVEKATVPGESGEALLALVVAAKPELDCC